MSDDDPSVVSVAYTPDQFSDAIAETQAAGDSARANELYVAQLAAMEKPPDDAADEYPVSGVALDDSTDDIIDSADEVESSDESLIDSFDDEFAELEPTPVEHTDAIYQHWRDNFGVDASASIQSKWGDNAVAKDAIVTALLNDTPELGNIYESHQTDDGGLSLEGISAATEWMLENTDHKTPEALNRAHPELEALYFDYANQDGALSPAGVAVLLSYIAEKSGYKHTRKRK